MSCVSLLYCPPSPLPNIYMSPDFESPSHVQYTPQPPPPPPSHTHSMVALPVYVTPQFTFAEGTGKFSVKLGPKQTMGKNVSLILHAFYVIWFFVPVPGGGSEGNHSHAKVRH